MASDNPNQSNKTLLVIAHAPSVNTQQLCQEIRHGYEEAACTNVLLSIISPLCVQPEHIQQADAIILFTPENLGYISGAMKDCFDRCYYPCLELTQGKPVAVIIRAGHDGTGSTNALKTITTGLRWRYVQEPLILRGEWQNQVQQFLIDTNELAQAMTIGVAEGII